MVFLGSSGSEEILIWRMLNVLLPFEDPLPFLLMEKHVPGSLRKDQITITANIVFLNVLISLISDVFSSIVSY
jgi:hypothetical protein